MLARSRFALIGFLCIGWQFVTAQVIQSSHTCNECHKRAFTDWQNSAHAGSESNPFYLAMLQTLPGDDPKITVECQTCHMPIKALALEPILQKMLSGEGVNCDWCHAMRLEKNKNRLLFLLHDGKTKYGPLKDAVAASHDCAFSPYFKNVEFCLSCHESAQKYHGQSFVTLADEWQNSRFAKAGVTCQDCHMPATTGIAAVLGKLRDEVHVHSLLGGRSDRMLQNSASIDLAVSPLDKTLLVTVKATNKTVGHDLPSGSPMRMVLLSVRAYDRFDRLVWSNWQSDPLQQDPQSVFMRVLADEQGNAPVLPWEAQTVLLDNRLRPGEPRSCEYLVPAVDAVRVEAELTYRAATPALIEKFALHRNRNYRSKTIGKAVWYATTAPR
ncbi:hypothetical protein JW992_06460 [candidate division KSB1 bacterium]|nr:hypothetical protein [candidate division KSB1 bacterium]